jgi:hypothetical protein
MEMETPTQVEAPPARKGWALSATARLLLSVIVVLLTMTVWALARFGSIWGPVSYYIRGETLFVDRVEKSFGVAHPGDLVRVTFRLRNWGRRSIGVLGCRSSCICTVPLDLPFTMGPNESRDFTLSVHASTPPSKSNQDYEMRLQITVFTNNPAQSRIPLVVRGRIRGISAR